MNQTMKHYLLTWYGITDFHATLGVDLQNVIAYGKGCQIACFCKHLEASSCAHETPRRRGRKVQNDLGAALLQQRQNG